MSAPGDSLAAGSSSARGSEPRWRLADLIDLEIFLQQDRGAAEGELKKRDGQLRQEILAGADDGEGQGRQADTGANRRWWLERWLQRRRRQVEPDARSTGQQIQSSFETFSTLFLMFGLVLGVLSLLGLLAAPVVINIQTVLAVYLLPQVVLALFAALALLRRRFSGAGGLPFLAEQIGAILVAPAVRWFGKRLDGSSRDRERLVRLQAGVGVILGRGKLHKEAAVWPLLTALQRGAAGFAFAVAAGMLMVGVFAHFKFGWATTASWMDADLVHGFARGVAAPWSWWLPEGVGYPSAREVELTQTFGGSALPGSFPMLSAWWAFLILSLFVWGLGPRIVLLSYSAWRARRCLARESFKDGRSDALYRRLARPVLVSAAPAAAQVLEDAAAPAREPAARAPAPAASDDLLPAGHCQILTELELDEASRGALAARINDRLLLGVASFSNVYEVDDQEACLARLSGLRWEDGVPRVILLYRACDPIGGSLRHLTRRCLDALGEQGHLIFGLVGRRDLLADPADAEEVAIWTEYAATLHLSNPNVEARDLTDPSP